MCLKKKACNTYLKAIFQSHKQIWKAIGFVLFLSVAEPYSHLSFGHKVHGREMAFPFDLISLYFIVTSMRHTGDLSISQ